MSQKNNRSNSAFKTILKKYWWIMAISLIAPIAINCLLLIPAFSPVVGTNIDWLAFFGSYIAAIIPALGSFIILFIQREDNHKENENNRQLQINVLKYQQEMQWLNENRDILIDCVCSLDKDHLVEVAHKLECKQDITFDVKALLDNLIKCDSRVGFMPVTHKTKEYNTFNTKRTSAYIIFRDAILDLQEINILFLQTGFGMRELALRDRIQQGYIHQGLNAVISHYSNVHDFLMQNVGDVSAMLLSAIPELLEDTREAALAYIKSEEKRISKLLTTEVLDL